VAETGLYWQKPTMINLHIKFEVLSFIRSNPKSGSRSDRPHYCYNAHTRWILIDLWPWLIWPCLSVPGKHDHDPHTRRVGNEL